MTRIRYLKQADGTYKSARVIFTPDGGQYQIVLLTDQRALITNLIDKAVHEVTAVSSGQLKIKVKEFMEASGFKFQSEARPAARKKPQETT